MPGYTVTTSIIGKKVLGNLSRFNVYLFGKHRLDAISTLYNPSSNEKPVIEKFNHKLLML